MPQDRQLMSRVREKIVNAALDRFHALGFNACGVQEIVDKAGVPKGSFYNYFKTKELLAIEVIEIYAKGSKREMLADTRVPPLERLHAHFEFLAGRYKEFGYEKGCLLGNLAAESSGAAPLIQQTIAQSLTMWTALVASAIREGQAAASIVPELNADEVARFMINSWEGAVVRMKLANSRQPLDDFFAVAFRLLRHPSSAQPVPKRSSIGPVSSRSPGASESKLSAA
jgi:TetR/AcrR family transcriptional regulator, transcriptional repressor for nem operon